MERELFLERVRTALGHSAQTPAPPPPRFVPAATFFTPDRAAQRELFLARQADLGVAATVVSLRSQAEAAIESLLAERGWSIACAPALRWPAVEGHLAESPAEAGFGLCEADYGIAETGSLVLRLGEPGRRTDSLLPPSVGFLLARSRIVARLGNLLGLLACQPASSTVAMISGPSASADIVGVRTIGVHGPGEVHLWLIESE